MLILKGRQMIMSDPMIPEQLQMYGKVTKVLRPTSIPAGPKSIREYFGRATTPVPSRTDNGTVYPQPNPISIAEMHAPACWKEPGQTPEFAEYTVVLEGTLIVELRQEGPGGSLLLHKVILQQHQSILVPANTWVRYSTLADHPEQKGCHYISVCTPAFSPHTVNRDKE